MKRYIAIFIFAVLFCNAGFAQKKLVNLGIGENGRRILKEETVKEYLAKSTRPESMEGYSLGLIAPLVDGEDQWFGHGGAWGTNCMVNWHTKELRMLVIQINGPSPWRKALNKAAEDFFKSAAEGSGDSAYTGRIK